MTIFLSDEVNWSFVRASYIVISNSIGNVFSFAKYYLINTTLTNGSPLDFPYIPTAINTSVSSYFEILSIFYLENIAEAGSLPNRFIK